MYIYLIQYVYVTHAYIGVSVSNGVREEQIDRNVMSVAELWLTPPQRYVYILVFMYVYMYMYMCTRLELNYVYHILYLFIYSVCTYVMSVAELWLTPPQRYV
jgi:hypothetical protein